MKEKEIIMNIIVNEKRNKKRLIYGILFLTCAGVLVASGFGVFGEFSAWQIIVGLVLLLISIKGVMERSFFVSIMPLAGIVYMFRSVINLPEQINAWVIFGAAALISIGLDMIFGEFRFSYRSRHSNDEFIVDDGKTVFDGDSEEEDCDEEESDKHAGSQSDSGYSSATVSFGDQTRYFTSKSFESAQLQCSFGELKGYFLDTKLKNGHGVIDATCSFGEIEIIVPKTWRTDIENVSSLADVSEKGIVEWDGVNVVKINAKCSFGAIVIKHV